MHWAYSATDLTRTTMHQVAADFEARVLGLIAHCTAVDHGGYTPTDFPDAGLGQAELDDFLSRFG